MYSLSVKNENNEVLSLTGNPAYNVLDISGTSPPVANINTSDIIGVDGSIFNSSKLQNRNIVLTLNINHPIEQNRLNLYRFFKCKRPVRLIYKNNNRDVYIDGYVETFENNLFSILQQPQISIICPFPYWKDSEDTEIELTAPSTSFSADAGEIETGFTIRFTAEENGVTNPVLFNSTTGKYIGVYVVMQQGDVLEIKTVTGQKSAKLYRNGVVTNMLASLVAGSEFVQLQPGTNVLSYTVDAGAADSGCEVVYTKIYEGV